MRTLTVPAFLLATTSFATAAVPMYGVTDLHTDAAYQLTANGTVFTEVQDPLTGAARSVSTIRNGHWATLSLPAGAAIWDVSDNGVVLARTASGGSLVQFPDGTRRTLQSPAGATDSYATYVNDHGAAVGYAQYGSVISLVNWNTAIPTLPHIALAGGLNGLNNAGATVVGVVHGNRQSPELIQNGIVAPLPGPTNLQAFGQAINDHNAVAGYVIPSAAANSSYGAIWTTTSMTKVMPLPGDVNLTLDGINSAGSAVGSSRGKGMDAVLWNGKTLTDLNTRIAAAGVTVNWAYEINGSGQILTAGEKNGHADTFLLTPVPTAHPLLAQSAPNSVPEPACLSLIAMAALLGRPARRPAPRRGGSRDRRRGIRLRPVA